MFTGSQFPSIIYHLPSPASLITFDCSIQHEHLTFSVNYHRAPAMLSRPATRQLASTLGSPRHGRGLSLASHPARLAQATYCASTAPRRLNTPSCSFAARSTSCCAQQPQRWRGSTWLARRSILCCARQLPHWRGSTWPFRFGVCVRVLFVLGGGGV